MPLQDKVVTVRAAQTAVSSVTLYPQADGSVVLLVTGATKDSGGASVNLAEARLQVIGLAPVDNLLARALIELRKTNALET